MKPVGRVIPGPVSRHLVLAAAAALALVAPGRAAPVEAEAHRLNELALRLMHDQRWPQARRALEGAIAREPDQPVLARNLAAACAKEGDQLRESGDDTAALELLDRAVRLHPGRVSYRLLRGIARFGIARDAERFFARQDFAAVLAVDPDLTVALYYAGLLAYQERRLEEAVRDLEHALRIDAEAEGVRAWLERARRELDVERRYTELRGAHFLIRHGPEFPPNAASRVLDTCEEAYGDLCPVLEHYPETVTVVTLYAPSGFQAATRLHPWVAGLSDGTIRLTVRSPVDPESLRGTIYHEFAHHLIRGIAPRVPGWIHEGIAQRAEGRDVGAAESRLRRERNLSAAELSIGILRQPDQRAVRRFYDLALAFTSFLHRTGGDAAILAILQGLAAERSEHTLLKTHFGASRDELFARWLDSLRSG